MKGKRVKVDDRKVRYGNKKSNTYHSLIVCRLVVQDVISTEVFTGTLCVLVSCSFPSSSPFLLYCAVNHRGLILAKHLLQISCWEMDFWLARANGWCWEEPGGRKRGDSRVLLLSLTLRPPLLPTTISHRPR